MRTLLAQSHAEKIIESVDGWIKLAEGRIGHDRLARLYFAKYGVDVEFAKIETAERVIIEGKAYKVEDGMISQR